MQKWEYKIVKLDEYIRVEIELKYHGVEGWELIFIEKVSENDLYKQRIAYFKRPVLNEVHLEER